MTFPVRKTTLTLNIVYAVIVLLFALDLFSVLEIKSQVVKSSVYFGFIVSVPLMLVWNSINIKTTKQKTMVLIVPILSLIFTILVNPFNIIWFSGAWKTQTTLYRNGHFGFKTIEFQLKDIGAMGYKKAHS
jgi:hypothetical protein